MQASLQLVLVILVALLVAPHALVDGQCSRTRIRKSLNQLNQAEWDALNRGIRAMKSNGSLDRLTRLHRQGMQWHGTPHFFLMHRALMADFENELLRVAPTLTGVPYWDELREGAGILRSDVFTNNRLSPIRAGPLQGVLSGLRDDNGQLVQRNPQNLSPGYTWLPPNEVMTRALERMANYGDFSRVVEVSPHNQFHVYIGGHMGNPSISPSDPAFWMHHAYIDLLWALWQSLRPQNRENLQAWGTSRPGIDPATPVVLYNGRYTNLDMLRYRTRLCYQYTMPSTRQSRLARRSFEMTRGNPASPPSPQIPPGEAVSINLPPQPQQPPAIRPPAPTQYVTETWW
ncbi:hypothetical protein BCR44DRAFT_1261951 [Catenaria anguillulae PL171]|uniref:Tyrosinase copper-binding domain-containing protein n=1 Tax=Catenaria anguillulae PL171 TaxID=765915 RepID=A0A1Y2HB26_9FUNG|nr:hypothetical protein BCR44DRAFT_1261951 [Catenaria anguillulae PL171]